MQSFLQYRRLGRQIREQVDAAKPRTPGGGSDGSSDAARDRAERNLAGRPDLNVADEDLDLAKLEAAEREDNSNSSTDAIGHAVDGVSPKYEKNDEGEEVGEKPTVFVVGWAGEDDPHNPQNWPESKKIWATLRVALIAFAVTMASSIDSAVLKQASMAYGVSEVAESLATANYLIGFGVGALVAGPLSEVLGRNYVYLGSLLLFMAFILGAALSPNFGSQITFRWLAGFSGSPALTLSGGTIADLYDAMEKTWAFPLFAISGFGGPILGPVISAYIGPSSLTFRWAEWLALITGGITFAVIFFTQPETYAPLLLQWKAAQLRKATGDDRFKSETELKEEGVWKSMGTALARPFVLIRTELIVGLMSLYLTVIYIVLFTFFDGYEYIFEEVYGTSQGLTYILFVAEFVGVLLAMPLVPFIYSWTKEHMEKNRAEDQANGEKDPAMRISAETRLWYSMIGAPALPISLFWMAWTCYSSVSIWSPIVASTMFGFGVICIFISAYEYIIDSYAIYSASALTFVALIRYVAAGGMTVVGIPFYENLGPHYTLTILACISIVVTPIPYALYAYGPKVRRFSKYAVNKAD